MSGYQRINFKDQNVERPKTYDVTNNPDGSITLIESFGNVEELGTPINQENMNHLEDGIDAVSFSKFSLDLTYKKDDLVTDIQDEELKIFKSLKDNNFGHLPSENDYWEEIGISGGGGSGFNLFDTKIADHILTFAESQGWALQGTYVSGALYPNFYNKCLAQYKDPTNTKGYLATNVNKQQGLIDNNGILSNFALDRYATIPTAFNPSNNPWEIVLKVTTPSSFASYTPLVSTADINQIGLQLNADVLTLYLSSDGSSWDIIGPSSSNVKFNTKTVYFIKLYFTGTQYKLDYKTQTSEWVNLNTIDNTKPIYSTSSLLRLGINKATTVALTDGEINLNESYIKINDSYFWMGTYKTIKNSNGHQFYNITDKPIVDTVYNTYGVAEFYGVDEENEQIFLPRNDWFDVIGTKSDTISAYGNGKTLGLTDGTYTGGIQSMVFANGVTRTGELQIIANNYGKDVGSEGENISSGTAFNSYKTLGVTTNPIKSGIVASNPVKPNTNKYLYYCVGNTVVNDAEIDAGALAAEIEKKANVSLDNVAPTKDFANTLNNANITTIIETYLTGRSGYNIYSNGYCEQWGQNSPNVPASGKLQISFLKKFKNTAYYVLLSQTGTTADVSNFGFCGCVSGFFTQESFVIKNTANAETTYFWRACGYLAEGEY